MKKEKILEEFKKTIFAKSGGTCFECCDYEAMYSDLEKFISDSLDSYLESVIPEKMELGDCFESQEKVDGFNTCVTWCRHNARLK